MIELVKIDKSTLDSETLDFSPIACTDCDFHGPFKIEYYLVSSDIETEQQQEELENIINTKLGFKTFTEMSAEQGHIISVCRCPKCGSEEIFQDF
jgi:hypothetical protein